MCECSVQLHTTGDVPLCRRHVTKLEMRDSIHPRVRGLLQPAGAEERAKAGRYDTPLIEERMTKNGTESCKLQTKSGTESAAKEQNRKLQGHQGGRPRLAAIHHVKIGSRGKHIEDCMKVGTTSSCCRVQNSSLRKTSKKEVVGHWKDVEGGSGWNMGFSCDLHH